MTPGVGDYMAAQDAGGNYRNALSQLGRGEYLNAASSTARGLADTLSIIPGAGDAAAGAGKGLAVLGTIVGPKATTWSKEAANKAKHKWITDKNLTKFDLAEQTKYYPDRANNWKTQLSDADSRLKPNLTNNFKLYRPNPQKAAAETPLTDYFKHDKLYEAYPKLATKVKVRLMPLEDQAMARMDANLTFKGDLDDSFIDIDPFAVRRYARQNNLDEQEVLHNIMIHELQHAVQRIEKHPGGSNPAYFEKIKSSHEIGRLKASLKQMPEDSPRALEIKEHLAYVDSIKDVSDNHVLYRHSLGEADAGWAERMRRDPDVANKLPLHETDMNRQYWEGKVKPFKPEWSAITSRDDFLTKGLIPTSTPADFGKFKQKKELKDFHNKMQNNIMEQAKGVRRLAAEWLENNNDTAIAKGTRVLSKQGNNIEITSGPMFNKRKGEVFYMVKYRDRAGDMQESSMPHWALKEFKVFGGPK